MGAIARRVPTVAVEQLVVPSRRLRGAVLKHSISRLLAGHVAVGHRSKEDLHRWFRVPRRSIDVIHNGVPERPAVGRRAATRLTVGCAARFEDQKQLDVLVRAMVAVPSADLVLIGDGSQRSSLEALVTTLGMTERVTITGWRPDARTLIESLDLFVLPSRNESFPLTIVEAMFASVPVIATDVGSVRDAVVHEETGLVVGAGDVDALARAIATLVSDEARRHRLGSAGRERALRLFTVDAMAAKYEAVWDRALRSGNVMRTG
jgi:glycosyltransferase involved in cell wall biosynthesis